jgi:hypothetical protein
VSDRQWTAKIDEALAKPAAPDADHTVLDVLVGHWASAKLMRESVAALEVQCANPLISHRLGEIGQAYAFIVDEIDKVLIFAPDGAVERRLRAGPVI